MRFRPFFIIAALTFVAVGIPACGDDSSSSSGGGLTDQICQDYAEHEKTCGNDYQKKLDSCKKDQACNPIMRSNTISNIFTCLTNLECSAQDDKCFGDEARKYENEPAYKSFHDKCMSKMVNECKGSDDFCFMSIFTDDALSALSACLDKPCGEQMTKCITDTIQSKAPGCEL